MLYCPKNSLLHFGVFPTPVGVFLCQQYFFGRFDSFPHARGGVSQVMPSIIGGSTFSPRPWGCFHPLLSSPGQVVVFPTPVGVFLQLALTLVVEVRFPHARGGVSTPTGGIFVEE